MRRAVIARVMITVMIMLSFLVVGSDCAVHVHASEKDQDDSYSYHNKVIIKDYADVLTKSQEEQLMETLQETARYCNVLCEISEFAFQRTMLSHPTKGNWEPWMVLCSSLICIIDRYTSILMANRIRSSPRQMRIR